MSTWTHFRDMHSGGGTKEDPYEHIYIEAPEAEAVVIFYNRFGHNPHRVTCTCCGDDYAVYEGEDLATITAFQRNCRWDGTRYLEGESSRWGEWVPLDEYRNRPDVLFISADDIKPNERVGTVPLAGYVWMGY